MAAVDVDTTLDQYAQLQGIVSGWDRRWRLTKTVLWLPRAFVPGLIAGLMLALVARTRPLLTPPTIALLALIGAAGGALIAAGVIWLWRRSLVERARHFDVDFGLGERISTALELGAGLIRSNEELRTLQLADAQTRAAAIRARELLPLRTQPRDWLIAVALAGALAILLLLPNAQADALEQDAAQAAAVEEAAETARDITQDVAADTDLGNEERQALLEQLADTIERLEQPNITPEEAFAAVSDMETALRERADQMGDEAAENRAALAAAADALRSAADGGTGGQSGDRQQGDDAADMEQVTQDLEQAAENAGQMTEEQRQAAADALRQAAAALQSTNPAGAGSLNNAADALENGDAQSAQEQLRQAQGQIRQQGDQASRRQAQAGEMSDQAQQMQEAGEQISEAQAGQPQQGDGQQAGEGGQPQDGQPGDQNSGDAQQGEPQSGEGQQAGDQGQEGGGAQQGGAGGGAGDESGDGAGDAGRAVNPPGQGNNPDGSGEGEYERVNVPRRIGGAGGEEIVLEPDASDAPVQEGEFAQNPEGQVTVPYDEVFGDYRDAANRALDSGYVPLGLRDVVRDYFTGLEPGQ